MTLICVIYAFKLLRRFVSITSFRGELLGDNFLGWFVIWPARDISVILRLKGWNDSKGLPRDVQSLNVGSPVERGGTLISHHLADLPNFFRSQSDVAGYREVSPRIRDERIRFDRAITASNPSSEKDKTRQIFIIRDRRQ